MVFLQVEEEDEEWWIFRYLRNVSNLLLNKLSRISFILPKKTTIFITKITTSTLRSHPFSLV